jgi:hypothetical protein
MASVLDLQTKGENIGIFQWSKRRERKRPKGRILEYFGGQNAEKEKEMGKR